MTAERHRTDFIGTSYDANLAEIVATSNELADRCQAFVNCDVASVNVPFGYAEIGSDLLAHANLCVAHSEEALSSAHNGNWFEKQMAREYAISLSVQGQSCEIPDEVSRTFHCSDRVLDELRVDSVDWEYELSIAIIGDAVTWEEARGYLITDQSGDAVTDFDVALDSYDPEFTELAVVRSGANDDDFDTLMGSVGQEILFVRRQRRLNQAMALLQAIKYFRPLADITFASPQNY